MAKSICTVCFSNRLFYISLLDEFELLVDKVFTPAFKEISTVSYSVADDTESLENTVLDQRPFIVPNAVAFSIPNRE